MKTTAVKRQRRETMSLRERRILSSMTQEAMAKAEKLKAEGKDPVTGKKKGGKTVPCPKCEVGKTEPPSGRKSGTTGTTGGTGGYGGGSGTGEKGGAA
jgi:hypothetical protein